MAQWAKGKAKQRDPPPALFVHSSPAASNVSLPGSVSGGGGSGGTNNNTTGATSPPASSSLLKSNVPTLSSLQRTTSRLRHEVTAGSGASGNSASGGTTSGGGGGGGLAVSKTTSADTRRSGSEGTSNAGGIGSSSSNAPPPSGTAAASSVAAVAAAQAAANFGLPLQLRASSTRATDRTGALWAEMQATLEEVELSASEGTRVFGPDHDRKLADLRQAQMALAQAWARSEADDAIETEDDREKWQQLTRAVTITSKDDGSAPGGGGGGGGGGPGTGGAGDAATSTAGTTTGAPGGGVGNLGAKLEEETQVDILLARKRREANDRYFQRVSQGVLDVVAKLEDVSQAMRAVEQESKDIWGDNDNESEHNMRA